METRTDVAIKLPGFMKTRKGVRQVKDLDWLIASYHITRDAHFGLKSILSVPVQSQKKSAYFGDAVRQVRKQHISTWNPNPGSKPYVETHHESFNPYFWYYGKIYIQYVLSHRLFWNAIVGELIAISISYSYFHRHFLLRIPEADKLNERSYYTWRDSLCH